MTGGGSDGCDDDNDEDKDDDDNKVPDSLMVVSSILSELDADILRSRVLRHNRVNFKEKKIADIDRTIFSSLCFFIFR